MERFLFCKSRNKISNVVMYDEVKIFSPSLFKMFLKGERKTFKRGIVRCWFQIITLGKAKLYFICDSKTGKVKHFSYVVPKCYKFAFLKNGDYEIGPCFTFPEFRGKNIYPTMLNYITGNLGDENSTFYIVVENTNLPSLKGIEKANFKRCGTVKKSGILKRYQRCD